MVHLRLRRDQNVPKWTPRGSASALALPDGSPACTLRWAIAAIGVLCAGTATFVSAQPAEAYSADAVKAEFLYRFAGYVEWPGDVPANGSFTIAVTGADGKGSLAWQISRTVNLAVAGFNLTRAHHLEFAAADGGEEIGRSFIAAARVSF